jgi:hypothetical protein
VRHAARVDDLDLAAFRDLVVPVASSRSRIACASANETLHPRKRVENVAMRSP